MRAAFALLLLLYAGCLDDVVQSDDAQDPIAPAIHRTQHGLTLEWTGALESVALALRFTGEGTCGGQASATMPQTLGAAFALLDSQGRSTLSVADGVGAQAGGVQAIPAHGPVFASASIDGAARFSGERWIWVIVSSAATIRSDLGVDAPALRFDVVCPDAELADVWAGRSLEVISWSTSGDAGAGLNDYGVWVAAARAPTMSVETGAGVLFLEPASTGADYTGLLITSPGGVEPMVLDGPFLRQGGRGEYTVRAAGAEFLPVGVLASAAPVDDLAAFLESASP